MKMRNKFLSAILLVIFVSMVALTGCGGSKDDSGSKDVAAQEESEKIVIRLANSSSTGDAVTQGIDKFKELVEERSDGAIEIQHYPNAVLGSDREATEAMQSGSLEMVDCTTGNTSSFIPELMAFELPYITSQEKSAAFFDALDNGELGQYYNSLAEEKGMKVLSWFDYGYRNFVTTKKPITCAADLQGLKIRTTASLVDQEVVKALKASPMQVAWADTYTAIQQGTVDAEGNTFTLLCAAKHDEVIKYAVDSGHNYSLQMVVINKKYWDKLSAEQQQILQECALEAAVYERELSVQMADEYKQKMIDQGIQVHELTDAERQEFIDATRPVWDVFKEQIPQQAIDLIQATQQ